MKQEEKLKQLEAWIEAQSKKIRALEKEIEKIKKHISQKKLNRWVI